MITVCFDDFEIYYFIEGLAKYGTNNDMVRVIKYVVPLMGKNTRDNIAKWFSRDCSYLYEKDSQWVYDDLMRTLNEDTAVDDYSSYTIDLPLRELKCYVKSCGFGSHLRQGVWEWMVNYVYPRLTEFERKEISLWLSVTFKDYFSRDEEYTPCGVDDYEQCCARYKASTRYILFMEYRIDGKEGISREDDAYLYNGEYRIDWSRVACDWERGDDYVKIKNIIHCSRYMPSCCSCSHYKRVCYNGFEGSCRITQEGRNRKQEICEYFKNLNTCVRKNTK